MGNGLSMLLRRFAPLVPIIFGIVFIIMGIVGIHQVKTFSPATGTIQSIDIEPGGADESDSYTVIVQYNIGGTAYYSNLGELKNGWHVGQEIDILYNPNDYGQIITGDTKGPIIGIIFGAVCVLAGILSFFRGFLHR